MNKVIFFLFLVIIQSNSSDIKNDTQNDGISSNFTATSGTKLLRFKRVVPSSSAGQGFCGANSAVFTLANILMMAAFSSIRTPNDCMVNIQTKMRRIRARNREHHWPIVIDPATNVSLSSLKKYRLTFT